MSFFKKLLISIAALLPSYLIRFSLFGVPTNLLEVSIGAIFTWGLLQVDIRKSWKQALKNLPRPVVYSVLGFTLAAVISTLISPHLSTSLGILKGWIIAPIVYAFMVYAATNPLSASPLSRGELEKNSSLDKGRLGGISTALFIQALILSGLVVALLSFSQLGQLDRIRGPFDVPNSLALFLAPLIILSIFHIPYSKFSRFAAVIMFLALVLTQSVAGVLSALIVVVLGYTFLQRNPLNPLYQGDFSSLDKGRLGGIILLAAIALILLLPKLEYLKQPGSSAYVRLQLWSVSWSLIKEHPLLGIGLGTFEPFYQEKLHERFSEYEAARQSGGHSAAAPLREFVFRDPHNWVLSFWLNLGLLGLVSFGALNGYVLWQAFQRPAALALVTLLLFGLTDTIFWKNDLAVLYFLLVTLAIANPTTLGSQTSAPAPVPQTAD